MVTGEYCETEYFVFSNGNQIYSAGNAPGESSAIVPPERGVGLRTMRKFCAQTAKEMAEERGEKYGGISRIEDRLKGEL